MCQLSHQQSLIESLFKFLQEGAEQQTAEPRDTNMFWREYDFIVVGAGTAGCVVANRLTENPEWNVLLLEAGVSENYIMDLPVVANYLQFTRANWNYRTQPSEKFCLAMENNQCRWPRGKVVGGSSVLNYMIYTRGNYRDYDLWEELGNPGWSYKDILPYYKKVENFTIDSKTPEYHGKDGYLTIGYAPFRSKVSEVIIKSAQQSGMEYVDINGPKQVGVSYLQVSMKDGVRHSSSRAYLHPIKDRPNFHFHKQAMVKKVLIDPETKQTLGVEVVINKKTFMNIPVIKHLKVGYNLMDHIAAGGLTFVVDKPYTIRTDEVVNGESLVNFLANHKGPLTLPGGCEILAFADLKNISDSDGYPDMELLFQAGSIVSDPSFKRSFGLTDKIYDSVFKSIENKHSFMVMPMLLRPKSKGRIVLENNNYLTKPLLFPNYYAHEDDMNTMVQGIKWAVKIAQQPALQAIGARINDFPIPGCKHLKFGSDQYWDCHARHFTFTIYHLSGTCKMGPKTDRAAVVDPRLRVYGLSGLRVIDASIMPEVPAAHTNAPVFMIAEKGSDMIKEDWGFI
ncbi:hypothetical protein FQR65_LT05015 [Abscondita terminalis]|nr:hypothetical protein FQR65_LT05015 [Abscondita terminalis]